jgi:hypothetical protein
MKARLAALCCALTAVWLLPAAAQQTERKHPADPSATAPAPTYESAFAGYQPLGAEKPGPWRELNDEVGRAGGHIGILRSGATAPATGNTGNTGNTGSHAGHKAEPSR